MTDHLARLRPGVRRARAATWDRTGGNDDFVTIAAGETVVLGEDTGPGQITHLWCTLLSPDLWWGRTLVLRAYWDGEETPSVEAPLGDFFGAGNCLTSTFSSALLEAAPRDGLALHSWFPMPFSDGFRITVTNDGPLPVLAFYSYVDYERWPTADPGLGRFHACWHREVRRRAVQPDGTYTAGHNLDGDDNYLLVSTRGRGHYLGAFLYTHSDEGGWYGEGDDMIFVDGDVWPPTVHGTGTEDWAGTAWSPATAFSHPFYGQPVADREDWSGFSSVYRLHVADPVPFEQSLRATLEHGHANDRADDWSSVAYWYQLDRTEPLPALLPVADREPPWSPDWRARVHAVRELYAGELAAPAERGRFLTGLTYLTRAVHRRDGEDVDRALGWLSGQEPPVVVPAASPDGPLRQLTDLDDAALAAWVADREPTVVLEAVLADWVGRFDPRQAGAIQVSLGVRLTGGDARQLAIADGRCTARGSVGPERVTLVADPLTWVRWSLGRLDPWEAVLRGRLVLEGDGTLALRIAALFPPYV